MTTIDFYTRCSDPLAVAARLVVKAWGQFGAVRVLTPDAAATAALDRQLWLVPATGFVPHCRLGAACAAETPVIVDHVLDHQGPAAVLVNLHPSPPPFFSRFERLAEIVSGEDSAAAAGRERWKFYRERGYVLRSHDLSERS
jgi:DNA polymerase III subunit chi